MVNIIWSQILLRHTYTIQMYQFRLIPTCLPSIQINMIYDSINHNGLERLKDYCHYKKPRKCSPSEF